MGQRNYVGADIAGIVEKDPVAATTLRANFHPWQVFQEDVKTFDYAKLGPVHILLGGPPCQPFSQATDGSGEYDPRDMIPSFIDAVCKCAPAVFVMEEVWTLTWSKHAAYLARVISDLEALGYVVDRKVIDMSDHGIPQARKRLFIVGVRADLWHEVVWPKATTPLPSQKVTMAAALGWDMNEAYRRASAAPVFGDPSWVFERPSTTVVGSFRPDVQAAPGYRKAGDGPRQNTPGSVVITIEEALRLQGMPRDWAVAGNEAQKRLQIGNSCPPKMTALLVEANMHAVSRAMVEAA